MTCYPGMYPGVLEICCYLEVCRRKGRKNCYDKLLAVRMLFPFLVVDLIS